MIELFEDRARIHRELTSLLESIDVRDAGDGTLAVSGTVRFGKSLVGPPNRLHGGLHVFARTIAVLDALGDQVRDQVGEGPVAVTLGLYRPLPLEESVPFSGTFRRNGADFELVTDFADREKLHAVARSAHDVESHLAWFESAYRRAQAEPPIYEIRAQGDIPMAVHEDVVIMPLGHAMRTGGSPTFARFVGEDGSLDAAAISVALDLLGAVTQGYAWKSRIYTARIDLVLAARTVPGTTDAVAMSYRNGVFDPEAKVRPAPLLSGELAGPTRVRVILADAVFERAFAYGTITLVPAPGELPNRRV